ncbi:hypothetical protein [Dysgonomonas sp. ZJ709]|uniref:hypothetical protein n=1 Tax=Dysgonomonas sp. ZJ709 TaxID=2709797 RepID=UPI00210664FE|nr:hypothetical protein [Dysgonomonas sp. ZJ709]
MKNLHYLLCITTVLLMAYSCGGSKSAVGVNGDIELILPCTGPEYNSDKEHFRSTMYSISTDMGTAKSKALNSARAELATSMNALVERTNDTYTSSYQSGEEEDVKIRINDLSRTIVKERLTNSRIICEKMMKTQDSKYRCYITVEVSSEDILNGMKNKLMNDEKLRTDFEYEKYKKIFDEEMGKLNNE